MKNFFSRLNQTIIKKRCCYDMSTIVNTQSGRCFIIGNGPSLTLSDLELLKNETTFASNRIYGVFPKTSWRPTYYVSQDYNVLSEIKNDLYDVSFECNTMILCGNIMRLFPNKLKMKQNVKFIYMNKKEKGSTVFDIDVLDGIHNVINVTYTMIELALFMGFKEIYLLGVDHNYGLKKNEKGEMIIDNNSSSSYFSGIAPLKYETKVNIGLSGGHMDKATQAFQNIEDYLCTKDQQVFNATRGGKLEVFKRISIDEVLCK